MSDIQDSFRKTVASYQSLEGAEAFVAKERQFMDDRNARVWTLLNDFDLASRRALDVGCGFGRDVAEFRRRGAEGYGCDISPPLLAMAEREVGPYFCEWEGLAPGGSLVLMTKCGEGSQLTNNLGENLPRVMVFYRALEITSIIEALGGVIDIADEEHSATAFGEALLLVQARKLIA